MTAAAIASTRSNSIRLAAADGRRGGARLTAMPGRNRRRAPRPARRRPDAGVGSSTLCPTTTMTFAAVPLLQRTRRRGGLRRRLAARAAYSRASSTARTLLTASARRADRHGPDRKAGRFRTCAPSARGRRRWARAGRGCAHQLVGHKWVLFRCRRPMRTWCWPRPTKAQLLLRAALDTGRAAQRRARAPPEGQTGNRSNASAEVEFPRTPGA